MSKLPELSLPLRVAPASVRGPRDGHIGALLVDTGKISWQDAERALALQKQEGLRFGEAAVKLGLVTPKDIRRVLSRQFNYPILDFDDSAVSGEVIAAYDPASPEVEGFRAIRSQLMLRWLNDDEDRKIVSVVSPQHGDGRSYFIANLAVVFSQLGERTLLIDADLRRPRQHKLFDLSNQSGLSAVLSGRGGRELIEKVPGFVDFSVLPAGAIPPNPQELLGGDTLRALLEDLQKDFDVILLDTSAAADGADAELVVSQHGGAMLLARQDRTRITEFREMAFRLQSAQAALVGVVLNAF